MSVELHAPDVISALTRGGDVGGCKPHLRVFVGAGRNDEALPSYAAALDVWPGYLPAFQGAAS